MPEVVYRFCAHWERATVDVRPSDSTDRQLALHVPVVILADIHLPVSRNNKDGQELFLLLPLAVLVDQIRRPVSSLKSQCLDSKSKLPPFLTSMTFTVAGMSFSVPGWSSK